jgi:hypothetical protein
MSERDLPEGTVDDGALSFVDGADAIETLLDPETDHQTDNEGNDEGTGEADWMEGPDDETDAEGDDTEGEGGQDEDGPQETYSQGKFASDSAKVTLDDGTVISVAELKRNNLFQRDYSRKTEELARVRETVEHRVARVSEQENALRQQFEILMAYASRRLPQAPTTEMMRADPLGYMEAKAVYDEHMVELQQLDQARQMQANQNAEQQKAEYQRNLQAELQKTREALPFLKDEKRWESFRSEAARALLNDYKFTQEELAGLNDHRTMMVIHDALAYRRLKANSAKTAEAIKGKPKLKMPPAKQSAPIGKLGNRDARARSDALRKSGTFEDGVAAIESLLT